MSLPICLSMRRLSAIWSLSNLHPCIPSISKATSIVWTCLLFLAGLIPVSTSAPKGRGDRGQERMRIRTDLNVNDFRMILAEDDTKKLGGYQGKIKYGMGTAPERDDPR